jgi:hypothetical protein
MGAMSSFSASLAAAVVVEYWARDETPRERKGKLPLGAAVVVGTIMRTVSCHGGAPAAPAALGGSQEETTSEDDAAGTRARPGPWEKAI